VFEELPLRDIIRIAESGGGFRMRAELRPTEDLIRIADAAARQQARVIFTGLTNRSIDELCRIAVQGQGYVEFDDM
jgi:hypothetical protein